tara:strand:+ start:36298 stop:37659 length:1362 start_codon:yes stop_codon:yes gene_type:complete
MPHQKEKIQDSPRRRIPEPPRRFPLGYASELQRDVLGLSAKLSQEFGGIVRVPIPGKKLYIVTDADLVHDILVQTGQTFLKGSQNSRFEPLLGQGLVLSNGAHWKRQRKLMNPFFSATSIRSFESHIQDAIADVLLSWKKKPTRIDVHAEMQQLTIQIILNSLFSGEAKKQASELVEAFHILSEFCIKRFFAPMPLPLSLAYMVNPDVRRSHEQLETAIRNLIEQRRLSAHRPKDLLTMLIESVDHETGKVMTDEEVRDELMTIFFAGYDTTSFALTMSLWLISQNPDIRNSLEREARQGISGAVATEEEARALTETSMAFREAMRMYPPVYMVNRTPVQDVTLGGFRLPRGSLLLLSIWDIHRSAKYWKDPLLFNPRRFAEQDPSVLRKVFLPFGGGSRACIGQNLAMIEGPMVLGTIFKHFRLEAMSGEPEFATGATLGLQRGMPMNLKVL